MCRVCVSVTEGVMFSSIHHYMFLIIMLYNIPSGLRGIVPLST